jgi:hypothetical protein
MSEHYCVECARELIDLGSDVDPPTRCEDASLKPDRGSPFADRLSINLRQLRVGADLSPAELGRRAAMHVNAVSGIEGDGAANWA